MELVKSYTLKNSKGAKVRLATSVTMPDGCVIYFLELMPSYRAIAQAKYQHNKEDYEHVNTK